MMCQSSRPADLSPVRQLDTTANTLNTPDHARAQLPKRALNPKALVFISSCSEASSPECRPSSDADPQEEQQGDPTEEEQACDGEDVHEHMRQQGDNRESRQQYWGWESPQGVLPPSPYHPAMHGPPDAGPSPKDAAEGGDPPSSSDAARRESSASPPPPAMLHHPHPGMPPYSWGGPYPVWYHEASGMERSASPPGAVYYPAGTSPPGSIQGGSPSLAPGFISVPLHHHRGAALEPGSPTGHGAVIYHHGGSPPPFAGMDSGGYGGHGGSPHYGASPPHSLGGSPPGGHYMYVPHHGYPHHMQQGHPPGPEYLAHHMGALNLGPGSTGSGGGGGGGQSRASARIARSHRAGGAYNPSEFDFDLAEADAGGEGARTTVMIRNVPNKYNQAAMLEVLHKAGFAGSFDFFYLPIDFRNRCGLGYAFINMLTPQHAARLYRAFHDKRWDEFNSKKVCEIKYARVQGRDALVEHFRTAKFPSEDPEYQPLVYASREEEGRAAVAVEALAIHAFLGTSATGRVLAEGGSPRAAAVEGA